MPPKIPAQYSFIRLLLDQANSIRRLEIISVDQVCTFDHHTHVWHITNHVFHSSLSDCVNSCWTDSPRSPPLMY